jgi:hypothetical protein
MYEKMAESSGNIVGYKVAGTITDADNKNLATEVKTLVDKQGHVRVMFDMSQFKWEKAEAWGSDIRFGHEFKDKIDKMAVVGDKTWEKLVAQLAKHFYARDAKYFKSADVDKAWAWLRE